MAKLGVQVVGDATGLKIALGESTAATEKWASATAGANVRVVESFKGVSTAALQAQVAQDRLAVAYGRYGEGSLGAAAATVRYRRELEGLQASSLASLRSVGRNLTTYVSLPLAAVGYESAKMALDFNRNMLLIQTQAGATAGEVKRLSGQVLELAKTTPQGPTELAKGLYHLESLGLRGAKAMETLKISALAAGMGIANLEDVTTALGGVVVTGIQGAQNYQQAMGTLTATVGAGNMRFEDLATSIGSVAPAAAAAGVTLPELGAAMATLTDRGFSADEAATRLRMSLALIQSPSEKAKKALKDMGVDANGLGAMLRQPNGLLKVLQTLNDAMHRVGAVRGNRDLLKGFGGGRSGLGILALVQSLNQSVSSYQQKLADVASGTQKFAANQQAYLVSPSYKLHSALSTIESDLTKLGQGLLPGITTAAKDTAAGFDLLARAVDKLPAPAKKGLGIIVTELAVGGPLLLAIVAARRAIRTIGMEFSLLPVEAAPGIAATGVELETGIGGAALAAEARVAMLRTALLGLGALTIAPIVIPIEYDFAKSKYNPLGGILRRAGAAAAGPLGSSTAGTRPEILSAITAAKQIIETNPGMPDYDVEGKLALGKYGGLPMDAVESIVRIARKEAATGQAAGGAAIDAAVKSAAGRGRQANQSAAAADSTTPSTAVVKDFQPSRAAELNLALAKSPNDPAAIKEKLAYDQAAAAFAEKRIKEGRGSKELVQQLEQIYGDEQSLKDRLQSLGKKAVKDAAKVGEFKLPIGLQIEQAKAALTAAVGDDAKAAADTRRYVQRLLKSGKLSKQGELDALNELASLQKNTSGQFAVPLDLQLQQAKADASGIQSKQVAAAEAIKKWAETIIRSKASTTQDLIDAYQLIAQENSVIGVRGAAAAVKESSQHFVDATRGLTRAQRKDLEERFAQTQAHGGYRPTGHGILGQTVIINVHGDPNPDRTAERVLAKLQLHSKHGTAQTRGPNAGSYMGLH